MVVEIDDVDLDRVEPASEIRVEPELEGPRVARACLNERDAEGVGADAVHIEIAREVPHDDADSGGRDGRSKLDANLKSQPFARRDLDRRAVRRPLALCEMNLKSDALVVAC